MVCHRHKNQNTVAPETAHTSPPTNQVTMISTNSAVPPLGQTAPPSIQGQFGNLPMVGGVPELPTPNMLGQLGNIPTMGDQKTLLPNMQGSYGNMPMTGGPYVHPPMQVPMNQLRNFPVSGPNMSAQRVSGSYGNNVTPPLASTQRIPVSGSQLYNQMYQVPPPPLLRFSTPQFVQVSSTSGDLNQASSLIPTNSNYQWSNIMNQNFLLE